MSSCEKCWEDAGGNSDRYTELVRARNCTPEEQAGDSADDCPECKRKCLHQYTHRCMNKGCENFGLKWGLNADEVSK